MWELVGVEYVVKETGGDAGYPAETHPVNGTLRIGLHEHAEVDAAEVAWLIVQQRYLAAGVGAGQPTQPRRGVGSLAGVDEVEAGVAGLPRTFHNIRKQLEFWLGGVAVPELPFFRYGL